jgi:3'-phosphoadenosine 5'-phosphosulfate (PAPS) 3'-phosphatase
MMRSRKDLETSKRPSGDEGFIEIFYLAARQAGCLARHLQEDVRLRAKADETSAEGRALTSVDFAAQDVILLMLRHVFPESSVDAEEETSTAQLFHGADGRSTIVLDPIDGTLNYSEGSQDYAVLDLHFTSVCLSSLADHGVPVESLMVYSQKRQVVIAGSDGQYARRLAFGADWHLYPDVSSDGRQVVFARGPAKEELEIVSVELEKGSQRSGIFRPSSAHHWKRRKACSAAVFGSSSFFTSDVCAKSPRRNRSP